tara:strand:- start:239 stop:625 length:387 start_codon:yes stop_codon:yes gene_type:complete
MIKLTHESVGKVYTDQENQEIQIIAVIQHKGHDKYYGVNTWSYDNCSVYNSDGVRLSDGCQLLKEYTPVRPIEEVMVDFMSLAVKYRTVVESNRESRHCQEGVEAVELMGYITALLAEAQALGVVDNG